jgi:hypothetical protein
VRCHYYKSNNFKNKIAETYTEVSAILLITMYVTMIAKGDPEAI